MYVFGRLGDLIKKDGWQVYDRAPDGYVLRRWVAEKCRWEMAVLIVKPKAERHTS